MINNLGYTKNLFILPFDHRTSFAKDIFGFTNLKLTPQQTQKIIDTKEIIYEAFKKAAEEYIPKEEAALLIDEKFGDKILTDAKKEGFISLLTIEKSGQKEFDFEYGNDFASHIEKYKPTFAKALIRYNPEDEKESKLRQQKNLKILSNYCHTHGYKFLLEVLIPQKSSTSDGGRLTPSEVEGEAMTPPRWDQYDKEIRSKLAIEVIRELQNSGIEPDVWKLEGAESEKDYEEIVKQAQKDNRKNVGIVILGRGESKNKIEKWLSIGAKVSGIIGFAVGRTVFLEPLLDLKNAKISKEEAINQIANNFKYFYDVFMKGKIKI